MRGYYSFAKSKLQFIRQIRESDTALEFSMTASTDRLQRKKQKSKGDGFITCQQYFGYARSREALGIHDLLDTLKGTE